MLPPWMCKAGHGFEDPVVEQVPVIKYTAHCGGTFVPYPSLPVARVHEAVLRPSDQMSIKEIDLAALEPFLGSELPIASLIRHFAGSVAVPELATENEPPPASVIETTAHLARDCSPSRAAPLSRPANQAIRTAMSDQRLPLPRSNRGGAHSALFH